MLALRQTTCVSRLQVLEESVIVIDEHASAIRIWDSYLKYASEEYLSGLDEDEDERWITVEKVREIGAQALHSTSWHFTEV